MAADNNQSIMICLLILSYEVAKNCTPRHPLRITLHHLPKISVSHRSRRTNPALQSAHVTLTISRFQSFIIFVGMSTIVLAKPWLKQDDSDDKKSRLPPDNMVIYMMPSLLDVLGTIVDTAGLYYVVRK